jgi:hypothetical protein
MAIHLETATHIVAKSGVFTPNSIQKVFIDYRTSVIPKQVEVTPADPENEIEAVYEMQNQGYVESWLNDQEGNRILSSDSVQIETFADSNILKVLHSNYLQYLRDLNPDVAFILSTNFK